MRLSLRLYLITMLLLLTAVLAQMALAADIGRFAGSYRGSADIVLDGETVTRDMSVTIMPTEEGFILEWTSGTRRLDGRTKEKTYQIEFVPSAREDIYQSAMKKNLFGKLTPLDPLQGEPFVWARFAGDTFSVFSLFITETGDYEMQEYHRTLVEGGMELVFRRVHNGAPEREISTFLRKES